MSMYLHWINTGIMIASHALFVPSNLALHLYNWKENLIANHAFKPYPKIGKLLFNKEKVYDKRY